MSVLDEEAYGDLDDFLERFGDDKPSLDQIRALQAALAPVLLRRMKEDVEDLPEKEEVVIWVELTQEQRRCVGVHVSCAPGRVWCRADSNIAAVRW
jgi:chromodomain-helicase-DNA-binding protein 7